MVSDVSEDTTMQQDSAEVNNSPLRFWLWTVGILLGVILLLVFLFAVVPMKESMWGTTVTPTPLPFRELTIPYLRERTYKSSLENLTPVGEGNNYTSYVVSYLSDGLRVNGLLTKPKGNMPAGGWPAIVFLHGYIPPKQYQTVGTAYSAYVDYLASHGFVVYKIDYRGHADSEGNPGGAYFSSDYVIDALNAYAALEVSDFVNSKKIGLWGHSMSGNVALRSFAVKPAIPAVVIWAGAVYSYADREKYGISDASYQPSSNINQRQNLRKVLFDTYGNATASAQNVFWKQMAPTSYLGELRGAIQLDHAVDDAVVSISYSRDLNALLDKTHVPHQFYEYPSGGHNISDANFSLAMQRTVEFFKKYLSVND